MPDDSWREERLLSVHGFGAFYLYEVGSTVFCPIVRQKHLSMKNVVESRVTRRTASRWEVGGEREGRMEGERNEEERWETPRAGEERCGVIRGGAGNRICPSKAESQRPISSDQSLPPCSLSLSIMSSNDESISRKAIDYVYQVAAKLLPWKPLGTFPVQMVTVLLPRLNLDF